MIHRVELCWQHQRFIDEKPVVDFKAGLNVVVGPNGSGKSSLLRAIASCLECRRDQDAKTTYQFFDAETMNPHVTKDSFSGPRGTVVRTRAMFSSHGEIMRTVLGNLPFREGDCLLIDEPEAGQDVEWVARMRDGLDLLSRGVCQIILASHHPVLWQRGHLIELQPDYVKKALAEWRKSF